MTARRPLNELKRPRRLAGDVLRAFLRCPLCRAPEPKVIAYRKQTVRLACSACECRFSVDPLDVADAMRARPEQVVANANMRDMVGLLLPVIASGEEMPTDEEGMRPLLARVLRDQATLLAFGVLARADDSERRRQAALAFARDV